MTSTAVRRLRIPAASAAATSPTLWPIVATGTVEALGQSITAGDDDGTSEHLTGLIGTNAGIQPGDSGGPLENASGQVIGMDTAASTATGFGYQSNSSQAFAIPINTALTVAKQIEAGHSTTAHIGATAFLGIEVQPSGFFRGQSVSGALIAGVVKASPASKAGLANGDVIVGLNTHTIASATSLTSLLQKANFSNTGKLVMQGVLILAIVGAYSKRQKD